MFDFENPQFIRLKQKGNDTYEQMLLPLLHRINENGKLMAPDGAEIQMKPAGIQGIEIA